MVRRTTKRKSILREGRRVLLIGACLVAGNVNAGGEPPQIVAEGIPHDMLYAVTLDEDRGLAVGDSGLVLKTSDGGKSWSKEQNIPTDMALLTVVSRNDRCIAGGQSGLILTSEDCVTWSKADSGTRERILGVDMNTAGIAYAVGSFGTVLKSTDGGVTWETLSVPWEQLRGESAEPHLYAVKVFGSGDVVVAGEFELVLRADSHGTWDVLHQGKRSLFGLSSLSNGQLYAVGQEGVILKSADQGLTWNELNSGTKAILTGVWADASGYVAAAGIYTLLYSKDGGVSWQAESSPLIRKEWNLAVIGANRDATKRDVLVVGTSGKVVSVQR